MFTEAYSFPHPVLGNDDDLTGAFEINIDVKRRKDRKIILENVEFTITNEFILDLIHEGKAKVLIKLYCSSTFSTWTFEAPFPIIEIDENELINRLDVQVFIVAKSTIDNFRDPTFNPQYGEEIFSVDEGEIIGISGKAFIPIDKTNEKLDLGNIFKFFHHEKEKPIFFEFHHDKIFIHYPITKKGEHPPKALFEKKPWTGFNIFIIPALADGLRYIEKNPDETWEWIQVFDDLLPAEERSQDYYFDSQMVLKNELPILMSYDELMR